MNRFHPYQTECFQPMNATSHFKCTLRDGEISVDAVTEDHIFYSEEGQPEAVISTISYLRTDDEKPQRPVMFFWNGGPGSASSVLHLECFGPYCMIRDEEGKPLCDIKTEAETILDICDLVYVDPVGVGYSRLLRESAAEKYFSVEGDARSITFAIADWLRKHHRFNSPIYLCGESYGTIRTCRILEELKRDPIYGNRMMLGLSVAGVILIGSALSINTDPERLIEPELTLLTAALPSMAAVNWFHNHQMDTSREDFVNGAWSFARKHLLPALFAGDDCDEAEITRLAKRLAYYTGIDADYFKASRLKLHSMEDFMTRVVAEKKQRVDLYDARIMTPLSESYNSVGNENVPLQVMNGILAPMLGVGSERTYFTGNLNVYPEWNYSTGSTKSHLECLRSASERMKDMKILVASGLYDLCTLVGNTRYQFSHSGIESGRVIFKEYPGGHGVYSSKEGKTAFLADVRALIGKH